MLGKHIVFIDSMEFMATSLDNLTKNLPEEAFKYTQVFKDNKLALMHQKGVYPFDYVDSFEKFNDPILPTEKDFYSMLTNTGITDEQYQHAQKVWSTFRLQNMGQYHDLYLKSDVLLLADVFENFRKTCLENIELDPVHYFTTPSLSWDVVLKMTGIKLELINDIDQYQFIKKACMEEQVILHIDMVKLITSICLIMMLKKTANISCTWILITSMGGYDAIFALWWF